jgi:hypothetical protein
MKKSQKLLLSEPTTNELKQYSEKLKQEYLNSNSVVNVAALPDTRRQVPDVKIRNNTPKRGNTPKRNSTPGRN